MIISIAPVSFIKAEDDVNTRSRFSTSTEMPAVNRLKNIQNEIRTKTEKRKIELRKNIAEKKEEKKEIKTVRLDNKSVVKVRKAVDSVYKKLTEKINKLYVIDSEITRRVSYITTASSSVSASDIKALLDSQKIAKDLLTQAKVDIEATRSVAMSEISTSTTKEYVKTLAKTAEASIKYTAIAYRKTFLLIKDISKKMATSTSVTSTTTATTTINN